LAPAPAMSHFPNTMEPNDLERGFGSYSHAVATAPRDEHRDKHVKRTASQAGIQPEEAALFISDACGRPHILDKYGQIREGCFRGTGTRSCKGVGFPKEVDIQFPPRKSRRKDELAVGRRYFRPTKPLRSSTDAEELLFELDVTAELSAASEPKNATDSTSKEDDLFMPLCVSYVPPLQPKRREELEAKLKLTPTDIDAWLELTELQWYAHHGAGVAHELTAKDVRQRQRQVLTEALQASPGSPPLLRALVCAEGDAAAALDIQSLVDARKSRLLRCAESEAAEELVWAYLDAAARNQGVEGGGAVSAIEKAAMESLDILATRKLLAPHDGRACAALERAQLAVISFVAFAWATSGHHARACKLLRANATLAVCPDATAETLRGPWVHGCRLGHPNFLHALQSIIGADPERQWGNVPAELRELLLLAAAVDQSEGMDQKLMSTPVASLDLPMLLGAEAQRQGESARMRKWVADELREGMEDDFETSVESEFDDLVPFLVQFRLSPSRHEVVLRLLDLLGVWTLQRHPMQSRYRCAFEELSLALTLGPPEGGDGLMRRLGDVTLAGFRKGWPVQHACAGLLRKRESDMMRVLAQALLVWPKDKQMLMVFMDGLGLLQAKMFQGMCRGILQATEDPHLFFSYARSLWFRGEPKAARQVFLRLCSATGEVDVRMCMAWWHLEHREVVRGLGKQGHNGRWRLLRLLLAAVSGSFEASSMSDDELPGGGELSCLQASVRLLKSLATRSSADGIPHLGSLPTFHASLLAACALKLPFASARTVFDIFRAELLKAESMQAFDAKMKGHSTVKLEDTQHTHAFASAVMVEMMAASGCEPRLLREAVWFGLRWSPSHPWLLMILGELHCRRGTASQMRKDLDRALRLHHPPALRGSHVGAPASAAALRVALRAEVVSPSPSIARIVQVCEKWHHAHGSFNPMVGSVSWVFHQTALMLQTSIAERDGRPHFNGEERWRVAVRAAQARPSIRLLWLLHLAAFEARKNVGSATDTAQEAGEDEEELLDLVSAMEARRIALPRDPLEAVV